MLPYIGDYIEHIDDNINDFKYYTFTPRSLMHGDMYKMDDELSALLIKAHRNIGFLEGLLKYAPNKDAFSELMQLKECAYSLMIDYDSLTLQDVLVSRGSSKGDIAPITNLDLVYKIARDKTISAPDLSKLCGIALYGEATDKTVDVRDKQTFLLGIRTNLKTYNPMAPDTILQALADISAYLYNDKDTDPLVKAALVHYQFEMIFPFEQYNGIIGQILVPMVLKDTIDKALPLVCLSEYLYYNKNKYFDLLRITQYSGGYVRWFKFFVYVVGQAATRVAEMLIQYEWLIVEDQKYFADAGNLPKSVFTVYEYLKRCPTLSIPYATKCLGLSFNLISKFLRTLQEHSIVVQNGDNNRNRVWTHNNIFKMILCNI